MAFQKKELDNRPGLKFRGADWADWRIGCGGQVGQVGQVRSHFRNKPGAICGCSSGVSGAGHQLACRFSDPCYLQLRIVRRPQLLLQVRCRYGEEFLPSSWNNQCSVHMQAGTYLVRSGAQDGLHKRHTFHRCTRRRLRARFHLALPLSRPSQSDAVVPVRHEMAISQPMGASGSQTRRLNTHSLLLTDSHTHREPAQHHFLPGH